MKVLVLGATGFIGSRLAGTLQAAGMTPVRAGRSGRPGALRLDARDAGALTTALRQVDAVVNCVAGSAGAIAGGASALARAMRATGLPRLVHVSSMAVYGALEGHVAEDTPLPAARGWYARAKQQAEATLAPLAREGAAVTVLRPGCVWGPGSTLWVGRIASLLTTGRLGDLGAAGDGWSNGVHVEDVCRAVLAALAAQERPQPGLSVFNLAAPDSPRWNDYFTDLALAIGATPLRRIPSLRLRLDAWLAGPPLHTLRRWRGHGAWPVSPGLPALFARQLRMEASAVTRALGLTWTAYPLAVNQGAAWWLAQRSERAMKAGLPST